jgi:cytochrome P450
MSRTPTTEQHARGGAQRRALPRLRTYHPLGSALAFGRDPLGLLTALTREYGDIVQFRLLHLPIVVLNHPDFIKRVLLDNHANYDKDNLIFRLLRPILGLGLVTNVGGEGWLHQRRLMQPAFHRSRIAAMGRLMTDLTLARLQCWEARAERLQALDIAEEMMLLTLQIVSQALFSFDMSDRASAFGGAFAETNRVLTAFARFPFPPLTFPTPSHLGPALRKGPRSRKVDKCGTVFA